MSGPQRERQEYARENSLLRLIERRLPSNQHHELLVPSRLDQCKQLLQLGADPNYRAYDGDFVHRENDPEGHTPLELCARKRGWMSIFEMLMSLPEIDVNKAFPLWSAASSGNEDGVIALLEHPDIELEDVQLRRASHFENFYTPQAIARRYKYDNIERMIMEAIDRKHCKRHEQENEARHSSVAN